MSLTKFNGDTNNIQGLADKPTQSASQLKALFDKIGTDIKTYVNEILTTEIDTELGNKANNSDVYSKTEANTLLGEKANSADVYTKTESDNLLNNKANKESVYTKAESDNLLNNKANKKDVYTKTESDNLLNDKANSTDLIKYKLNGDFAVVTGEIRKTTTSSVSTTVNYPTGFSSTNSVLISLGCRKSPTEYYFHYGNYSDLLEVALNENNIEIQSNTQSAPIIIKYKIVLMKIS